MIAGISGLLSLAGTALGFIGASSQAKAAKKAEKMRERQMQLEASRNRRAQIRNAQVARAQAVSAGTNQGAGQSSALQGGIAQIQGTLGRNILAINQDETIGSKIFEANRKYAEGGMLAAFGSGVSSLGGAFSNQTESLTRFWS